MGVILDTGAVIGLLELTLDRSQLIQAIRADPDDDPPAVSVITLGELASGVHTARDQATQEVRQRSLDTVTGRRGKPRFDVVEIGTSVWQAFGLISAELTRRIGHNDKWIAATAVATNRTLITQDAHLAEAARAVPDLKAMFVPRQ